MGSTLNSVVVLISNVPNCGIWLDFIYEPGTIKPAYRQNPDQSANPCSLI